MQEFSQLLLMLICVGGLSTNPLLTPGQALSAPVSSRRVWDGASLNSSTPPLPCVGVRRTNFVQGLHLAELGTIHPDLLGPNH